MQLKVYKKYLQPLMYTNAEIVWVTAKKRLKNLNEELVELLQDQNIPYTLKTSSDTLRFTLPNGGRLTLVTAGIVDTLRGLAVKLAICDDNLKDKEFITTAVLMPLTLQQQGQVLLSSSI